MGKNWHISNKGQTYSSNFDNTLKKFYQAPPKHGVAFRNYKSELKHHVQVGTHPAFGYPLSLYEERQMKTVQKMPK